MKPFALLAVVICGLLAGCGRGQTDGEARAQSTAIADATPIAVDLIMNENPRAPLAAVLSLSGEDYDSVALNLTATDHSLALAFSKGDHLSQDDNRIIFPVVGLRANQIYEGVAIVTPSGGGEKLRLSVGALSTPALPNDRYAWPAMSIKKADAERMEPGLTVLSVRRHIQERPQLRSKEQTQFMTQWGLLIALDNEGEVVWYYEADRRIAGVEQLTNGNILYQLSDSRTVEINWLGETLRQFYAENRPQGPMDDPTATAIAGIQTLHHQPHETARGVFLSFSANARFIENWYTNEYDPGPRKTQNVMGDTIIEFSEEGEILWSWNAWDYLDPFQIGYEAFDPYWTTRGFPDTWDWTHGNGVTHDGRDDSVVASFKLLDAIIKIDRESKDMKWIFGDHIGWSEEYQHLLLTPIGGGFRWPYHQHNPRWTHAGTLLVFNNNRGQTKPFDGREQVPYEQTYSYTVEYEIDEEAGTVRQVWISEPEMTDESCVSFAMSEAHRLPQTDNILEINAQCGPIGVEGATWDPWILDKPHIAEMPRGGRVREYTRTSPADVVFEARFEDPSQVINWEVYGGYRTPHPFLAAVE
ncbi:MAG: aryl-sulfate sulfotransferase [Pseudomonadota bacterium]